MKKIDLLRALQEIDTALDQVRLELQECRERLGDDSRLAPLREELESARPELRQLQDRETDLNYRIEDRSSRLKGEEKKLYDGSIRNPKELGQLAREVEAEKEQISKLEDQILANMDALEAATSRETEAAKRLAAEEKEWRAEQDDLQSRCAVLSEREADLNARRKEAASRVDFATLRAYDSVRRMRAGVAVVPIERGACQGCRISLSSAVVHRARSSPELVPCQSCGRFLYVP